MAGEQYVQVAAALRGQGDFQKAIETIEANRSSFDDESILPALLQAYYAAEEAGDLATAKKYAREIEVHDPDIPSIQRYLP